MKQENVIYKAVGFSAMVALLGTLLSGFVGVAISSLQPQPPWEGVDTFIRSYHPIQITPYVFGILFIFGSCFFTAAAGRLASGEKEKIMAGMAGIFIAVYAVLIAINYVFQMAFVPAAIQYNKGAIPALTMVNPASLSWAVEMFGYAFQGVALWLLAPVFKQGILAAAIRWLLLVNGVMSIAGAAASCIDITYCMTPFGSVMFVVWNLLFMVIMALVMIYAKFMQKKDGSVK